MANYNSGSIYNAFPKDGGAFYNGVHYDMFIRLRDVIESSDTLKVQLAKYILTDNFKAVYDSILQTALYEEADDFTTEDDSKLIILFKMAEEFRFDDELAELTVLAYLYDRADIIDEIKELSVILDNVGEEFNFYGPKTRDASNVGEKLDLFAKYVQQEGLEIDDLESFLHVLHSFRDNANMTDSEPAPRLATMDWLIGNTGLYDTSADWLLPFELMIDWSNTSIQVMPEAELTTVESPGTDGDMVSDVVYKSRLFQIVGYSKDGLSQIEKQNLKRKIANLLATTKNQSKKLAIQSRNISFDVMYSGLAEIKEGPSFVKATLGLHSSVFGYNTFENSVVGSGLIKNEGSIETGVRHIISGPITNPSFTMDGNSYSWTGTVPNGYTLTVDHEMKSVWLTDPNGVKTNQLSKFNGKFMKIQPETSVVITVPSSVGNKLITSWRNNLIW